MTFHVFLSFTTEDEALAELFCAQAETQEPSLLFHNYLVKETFDYAWRIKAEQLIGACKATICLIGKTTHRSDAVNWEIRRSAELGKHVVGVTIEPSVPIIPVALAQLNVELLRWDVDMEKILGELNDVETGFIGTETVRKSGTHHTTDPARSFGTA